MRVLMCVCECGTYQGHHTLSLEIHQLWGKDSQSLVLFALNCTGHSQSWQCRNDQHHPHHHHHHHNLLHHVGFDLLIMIISSHLWAHDGIFHITFCSLDSEHYFPISTRSPPCLQFNLLFQTTTGFPLDFSLRWFPRKTFSLEKLQSGLSSQLLSSALPPLFRVKTNECACSRSREGPSVVGRPVSVNPAASPEPGH